SDYLTEQVRSFTVTGDTDYVKNFFEEVNDTKRRDKALETMEQYLQGTDTYRYLQEANALSNELVKTEHYAMRLAADAYGLPLSQYPAEIRGIELQPQHLVLDGEEKRAAAIDLVFNDAYQSQKDKIRGNVNLCNTALIAAARGGQTDSSAHLLQVMNRQSLLIAVLMLSVLGVVLFTTYLVIQPLYGGIERIRKNEKFPVSGSQELRYLAQTYNEMYEATKKQQETLSYEASHDALTGLSNRKMFDHEREVCDPQTTAMILIDVDHFKEVNDTYGHETGDKLLKRVAGVLRKSFRSEDYVCRIGGDEFAVLMMNSDSSLRTLVQRKIEAAQAQLRDEADGIPGVTLSVGVAFPDRPNSTGDIYRDADTAQYRIKNGGKDGLAFYE
ncbi:MAG: GGDEF domain-containing protein, partial [Firmicutes bacterium]|nr:GGDEF domain-containing protein [Bacillota bacterium]